MDSHQSLKSMSMEDWKKLRKMLLEAQGKKKKNILFFDSLYSLQMELKEREIEKINK